MFTQRSAKTADARAAARSCRQSLVAPLHLHLRQRPFQMMRTISEFHRVSPCIRRFRIACLDLVFLFSLPGRRSARSPSCCSTVLHLSSQLVVQPGFCLLFGMLCFCLVSFCSTRSPACCALFFILTRPLFNQVCACCSTCLWLPLFCEAHCSSRLPASRAVCFSSRRSSFN